jgi:hypothetical protein
MEISFRFFFSTVGAYTPTKETEKQLAVKWWENVSWENQYGRGRELTLNLVWFSFSVDFFKDKRQRVSGLQEAFEEIDKELNNE